jgi:cell division protease FtsH
MVAMETLTNQYLGGDTSLACSAETQALIDKKVVELVRGQHRKALQILQDNKQKMDELAEYLYFRETITGEEFMTILTRKPIPKEIPMSGSIHGEDTDYVSDEEDTAFTAEAAAAVAADAAAEEEAVSDAADSEETVSDAADPEAASLI